MGGAGEQQAAEETKIAEEEHAAEEGQDEQLEHLSPNTTQAKLNLLASQPLSPPSPSPLKGTSLPSGQEEEEGASRGSYGERRVRSSGWRQVGKGGPPAKVEQGVTRLW